MPPAGARRRWPLVAVGVVVLVLVGGGVAAVTLLRGGDARTVDGGVLPAAVTSEPERAWTYDYDGDYLGYAVGVGDRVVLVDEDGDVVGLDADGEREWTADDRSVSYVVAVPDRDDLVIVAGGESGGVGALSTEDGHELWWTSPGFPGVTADGGLLVVDSPEDEATADVSWTDPKSGDEKWGVLDVSNFGLGRDAVYTIRDGELSRLDQDSGKEDWSVDVPVDDDEYVQLVATDDMVTVTGDDVTAYEADSGDELWTYEPDDSEAELTVGAYAVDRVFVSESSYDEDYETTSTTVTVRDRDGTVGEIDVDDDDYVFGTGVESGGKSWFINIGNGEIYDEEVQRVASYDGSLTLADKGVYAADDSDEVAFYEYGEAKSTWEIDLPGGDSDSRSVYAVDNALLVADDGELTAYR